MAGPPRVIQGLKISKAEAAIILRRDVETFADGVRDALRRDVSANQFAALTSFAYNVGLGHFRSSSVLKAVNRGDFEAVPRRLQLWIKAGPRVLPGLVKRRAAEAQLFMQPDGPALVRAGLAALHPAEARAMDEARGLIEPLAGKSAFESTTIISTVIGGITGLFGYVREALWQWQDVASYLPLPPRWLAITAGAVIIGAACAWIISERLRTSREDAL